MAIITATSFQAGTGLSVTGADLTALSRICAGVDAAIRRAIYPFAPEPVTITDLILDAPADGECLVLPVVPARSITSLYVRGDANGLLANFTSDYLLDNSTGLEYWLKIDRPIDGYSRSGLVYRRRGNWGWGWGGVGWGGEGFFASRGSLAGSVRPGRGAVRVTYEAGPASVPDDLFEAAKLMVALLYARRATGVPVTGESWNGYNYSTAGPFTAAAALTSPDVQSLLSYYLSGVACPSP